MKKMKNLLKNKKLAGFVVIFFIVILLLYGISNRKNNSDSGEQMQSDSYNISYNSNTSMDSEMAEKEETVSDNINLNEQKMIITWNLSLETEQYDKVITSIQKQVKALTGYIESEDECKGTSDLRQNNLTIRIPADHLDDWMTATENFGTITSKSKTQQNVTLDYIDTESRVKSLRAEQTALMAMLEKASKLSDIIAIREQLQNINYQIDSYESQLRYMQNDVDYATINLSLTEVNRELSEDISFSARIAESVKQSARNMITFCKDMIICISENIVQIIFIIIIVILIVVIVRRKKRRTAHGKESKHPSE